MRWNLAWGLVDLLDHPNKADQLRWQDQLLEELRHLVQSHLEDADMRHALACGLYVAACMAAEEKSLIRFDHLTWAIRGLAERHPNDAWVERYGALTFPY